MAEFEGTTATGKVVSDLDSLFMHLPLPGMAPRNSEAASKVGIRMNMLITWLKVEYNIISRQKNVSKFFESDMLPVVDNCWQQIHDKLMQVVESENQRLLEEFDVMQKLSHLESVNGNTPAWRPTGIPQEDIKQNTDVALRESIPELERLLSEVQKVTAKLQVCISEKQHKLLALETQINDKIEELDKSTHILC